MANTVMKEVKTNNDVHLPSPIAKEQSVSFATDKVDFKNDTRDDKNLFQRTEIVVYGSVKNNKGNLSNLNINLENFSDQRSYKSMGLHNLVICLRPITENRTYRNYREQINFNEIKLNKLCDTCWFLLKTTDTDKEVPTWGVHNSLICDHSTITVTKHCVLPLLHESRVDWPNLYSAFKIC